MTPLIWLLLLAYLGKLDVVFASESHKRLFSHLFHLYDFRVIPVRYATEPMAITVENIKLKRILNIDEGKGTVDIGLWISISWKDGELVWCPSSYGGVKKISLPASDIWTPDLVLSTGIDEVSLRDYSVNDVVVMSDGRVYYYANLKLTLPCLNHTHTNNLECNFAVGSWTLLTDIIQLYLQDDHMDITQYVIDPNYRIKSESLVERNVLMTNFPMPWKLITARIKLERIPEKNSTVPKQNAG